MHIFFKRLMDQPHLANVHTYNNMNSVPDFSVCFDQLFPANGRYGRNTASYLNVIAGNFTFSRNEVPVHRQSCQLVTDLFHALRLNPNRQDNQGVYNFWLYLTEMYAKIVETSQSSGFYREDHIFGFMSAFNLHHARVIIIASDPSQNYGSSGFAFHSCPTASTRQLLDNFNAEMGLAAHLSMNGHLTLNQNELYEAKNNCDLSGWIEQRVVLLNSWLTCGESQWEAFTNFLIEYMNREMNDLVFILMGQVAFNKVPLIDYNKHLVLRVHHPSHYHRRTQANPQASHLEWNRVLPFINANFYLYQVAYSRNRTNDPNSLIDWHSIGGGGSRKLGWNERWQDYTDLFDEVWHKMESALEEGRNTATYWDETTGERALIVKQCLNGRFLLQRHQHYHI